jgi:hypothetical protein
MKTLSAKAKISGLTLIEVLAVLAILVILGLLLLPATIHHGKPTIMYCINNQKQISLGFILYEADNNGKLPMQFSETNGGTMEFVRNGHVFPHIKKISQYYSPHSIDILICPSDIERHPATNFESLNDLNISYFLNADISTNNPSASILTGDRNLEAVNEPLKPGLFVLTTNVYMTWTDDLHKKRGCLSFGDGHVEWLGENLNSIIQRQPLATNRLCVP